MIFTATHGGGIFRSTDNGDNWVQVNNGLTNLFVRSLTISQYGQIFAATNGGLYSSTDNGENWTSMNEGLFNVHLNSIIIDQGGYLFVGALISGAYRSINPITAVEDEPMFVSQLTLYQNYPNPFNPSTKISWQSPVDSWQTIKIYDVLGNEVSTIVDEYKTSGSYEVVFNTSSIKHHPSSGVYFYQLKSGDFIQTKKMILLR